MLLCRAGKHLRGIGRGKEKKRKIQACMMQADFAYIKIGVRGGGKKKKRREITAVFSARNLFCRRKERKKIYKAFFMGRCAKQYAGREKVIKDLLNLQIKSFVMMHVCGKEVRRKKHSRGAE